MRRIAQAYNHLHGSAYNRVELKENHLVYVIDDREFPYAICSDVAHIQFTMEYVLIIMHSMLRHHCVSPRSTSTAQSKPPRRIAFSSGTRRCAGNPTLCSVFQSGGMLQLPVHYP